MITRYNLIRFILSVFSVAFLFQFLPVVASAQTITCPVGWVCTPITGTSATLSLDAASPLSGIVPVTNKVQGQYLNLPVLVFDVNAQGDDLHLHNVTVNISSSGNGTVNAAYLYQGSTPIASASVNNGVATFKNIADNQIGAAIPLNTTTPFVIKVDVSGVATPGAQEIVNASVPASNLAVYDSKDNTVSVSGSVSGSFITVAGPGPIFSIAGTPTFTQQNIITSSATATITTMYAATFNVNVTNVGTNSIALGLPNSSNPAFGGVNVSASTVQLYVNGVAVPHNNDIQVVASYNQPANTVRSTDGQSFIIAQNQTATIPVTYNFAVSNQGADVYGLQLLDAVYSNTNSNPETYITTALSGACTTGANCSLIGTTSPMTSSSATVTGQPTLQLSYNTNSKQSELTATFHVSISAGNQSVGIYPITNGGIAFIGPNGDTSSSGVNQQETITPLTSLSTTLDSNGNNVYVIPAGQTVPFIFSDTINPQLMFAGSYYATLAAVSVNTLTITNSGGYFKITPSENKTNSRIIIGETSPYISSVTSPISVGQNMTISGQRLGRAQIIIDNFALSNTTVGFSTTGTNMSFTLPRLSTGYHTIFVTSNLGKSNIVRFEVQGTSSIAASAVVTGQPILVLSYNSKQQESLLTGTFNVTVNGGSQGINVYKNNAGGTFYSNTTGQQVYANSQSVVSFVPVNPSLTVIKDNFGQSMYVIPAGQSAVFKEVVTSNPQQLFADTYYAGMFAIMVNPGADISNSYYMNIPIVKSNLVTIVGELGPYISSVTTPISVGGNMAVNGQRLNGGSVSVDGSPLSGVIIGTATDGTELSFNLPLLSNGSHTLVITNSTTGASNVVAFQVVAATSSQPSITITSPAAGEVVKAGSLYTIKWSAVGMPSSGYAYIRLLTSTGSNFDTFETINSSANNTCQVGTSYSNSTTVSTCTSINSGALTITIPDYSYPSYTIPTPVPTQFKIDIICKIGGVACNNAVGAEGTGGVFNLAYPITTGNKPPVISGGTFPTTLVVGQTGTWSVIASDPQNSSLSYSINWGDQTPTVASRAANAVQTSSFTHAYGIAGNYTVIITVTDSAGLSAQTQATVNVTGNSVIHPINNGSGNNSSGNYSSGNYSMNTAPVSSFTANVFNGFINFLKSFF